MRRVLTLVLKKDVSRLNDVHCDWALDRTYEVPNEVKDLERSGKLCGRAVADNENEAGKLIRKISRFIGCVSSV